VTAGAPIADIDPGSPDGKAGFDVRGTVLPPERAIPLAIGHDDSIKETPRGGGVRLEAAVSGDLSYDGKDLRISGVRSVKGDAGKATGNISFPGDVNIGGKVEAGFAIAGRNVSIAGLCEAALISAGGRAHIAGGIRGAGKGVVRARATIETAFADRATLLAVEDIKAASGCLGCNIKTNGRVLVFGEKGRLSGGVCRARLGVYVQELGSEKGERTEISFGQDYLLKDKIEALERDIDNMKEALKRIDVKIKTSMNNPAALSAAGAEKVKILKATEQLNIRLFTMLEKFEEHHESEVQVRGVVHPGVVMESHGRYYEVNRPREGAAFYFDRETGRIKIREQ
jgi:uncharacterized protein (DUF342 family)